MGKYLKKGEYSMINLRWRMEAEHRWNIYLGNYLLDFLPTKGIFTIRLFLGHSRPQSVSVLNKADPYHFCFVLHHFLKLIESP